MIPAYFLKKSFSALAAFFLLNAAALSYLPAVHSALHAHEEPCAASNAADSKDLCSAQNHLAADLASVDAPKFEVFQLPEAVLRFCQTHTVLFTGFSAAPRAPPVSPAHP